MFVKHTAYSKWRDHVASRPLHPHCTPACALNYCLGKNKKSFGDLKSQDIRRPLTEEDWKKWGLAVALAASKAVWDLVPKEYRDKGIKFLGRNNPAVVWVEGAHGESSNNEEEKMDVGDDDDDEGHEDGYNTGDDNGNLTQVDDNDEGGLEGLNEEEDEVLDEEEGEVLDLLCGTEPEELIFLPIYSTQSVV
ncbi:hypothetical protein DXG01_016938 [Tephrocybe rancida]|nr:hypothetical protein DXG01_016938 [Tephrocybe rancida]